MKVSMEAQPGAFAAASRYETENFDRGDWHFSFIGCLVFLSDLGVQRGDCAGVGDRCF